MKKRYLSVLESFGYEVTISDFLLKVKFPNYHPETYSEKEYYYLSKNKVSPGDYVLIQVGPNEEHLKFAKVISSYPVKFYISKKKASKFSRDLEEREYPIKWVMINLKDKSSDILSDHFLSKEKNKKRNNGEMV